MDEIFRDQNAGMALFKLLADLIQKIFVISLVGYLAMHTRHIPEIWERRPTWKTYIIPVIIFGLFSIFGTYTGIVMPNKAIVNFRDLGPMIAGLIAGPIVGFGAGLVGGIHRYFLGGETRLNCALATILIGLISGLVYKLNKGKFIGFFWAVVFAAVMEIGHVGLALIILKPFDHALEIASNVGPPMIVVNTMGMCVFAFIIRNLIREKEIESEKDALRIELEVKSHELLIAREIQRSILPASPPALPGYDMAADMWPAKEIGGDFYDFIPLSENPPPPDGYREHAIAGDSPPAPDNPIVDPRLGIVIADVS
ncbi:MAG TPA: LytS/YhcK type 5TM receptor domain-containing protein, partial [Candidatus Sumerlaeia bacterium]|nr:LytS/YhcK type 5TM receptor domain-containing protein [Candidatus Sumerlaeia bacterium]